ncbi:MAG: 16S rRNA (guanine(527)-N(7))-methyltransferase RsmG [Planctomycetes bacterium]|nr:16S rRNA (guanine(527)-N(7))-methyltransferase RsmG [Planctomycetota bacterium]
MFQYQTLNTLQCERFSHFAEYLQQENRAFNLTRIVDTSQIYLRHFADSLEALPWLDAVMARSEKPRLIDVGSGAGLPGLAIAIARPQWEVISLDATGKKIGFQQRLIRRLGLANVTALQGRAEELAHQPAFRERFDAVLARAVAHLQVVCELCVGFLSIDGRLVTAKGSEVGPEIEQARSTFATLQLDLETVTPYSLSDLAQKMETPLEGEDASFNLLVLTKKASISSRYPRPFGAIKKSLSGPYSTGAR